MLSYLFSIGHGNRSKEVFLELLQMNNIHYLVDVRTYPYSRFNPQYNQKALKEYLEKNEIRYIFMGDQLGGKPVAADCYTSEGKINYELVKKKDFFQSGIERLKKAYSHKLPVAIMCSESKPAECHRTNLIGEALAEENIFLQHIDEKGMVKEHKRLIIEMGKGGKLF